MLPHHHYDANSMPVLGGGGATGTVQPSYHPSTAPLSQPPIQQVQSMQPQPMQAISLSQMTQLGPQQVQMVN